jgi:prepilin-type N-terminal cleavage/methylation domain-containing protein
MTFGAAIQNGQRPQRISKSRGFTLVETVIAMAIAAMVMAGMFQGYTLASRRAQYSAFSLAANAAAMKQMERIVAAQWVISGVSVTNIFNPALTAVQINALGMPSNGTNLVYATNYSSVTQLSVNPPYLMVRVDCAWNFMGLGVFTNSVAVMRGPDL